MLSPYGRLPDFLIIKLVFAPVVSPELFKVSLAFAFREIPPA
jgi:hypothetical protein